VVGAVFFSRVNITVAQPEAEEQQKNSAVAMASIQLVLVAGREPVGRAIWFAIRCRQPQGVFVNRSRGRPPGPPFRPRAGALEQGGGQSTRPAGVADSTFSGGEQHPGHHRLLA